MPQQTPRIYLSPPHMSGGEQARIAEVFASNWIAPAGPQLKEFERRVAQQLRLRDAAAVCSGTAALHLALRALTLEPDDEIICPTFTFCATVNPILYERARPYFLDIERQSWNLDANLLEDELRERASRNSLPAAVMAVDMLGQSADMDAILQVCGRYQLPVIEDAAEAIGATYRGKPAGSLAWATAISFNGNKIITTSGGGMLCSNDAQLIDKARHWATQAKDPGPLYVHSELGYNYRLSNVLAAIGLAQLDVLEDRVATRRRNFEFYQRRLGSIPGCAMQPIADWGEPNYWLSVLQIDPRHTGIDCEKVRLRLEEENIESRRVWVPLHKQAFYAKYGYRGGQRAESVFARSLCLPSGSSLTEADLERICQTVETSLRQA